MIAIKPKTLCVRDQVTGGFVPLLAIKGKQGTPGTINKEKTIISALEFLYGGTIGLKYRLDGDAYTVIGMEDELANSGISAVVIPPSIAGIPVTKIHGLGITKSLTSVTISENIEFIGNYVFHNCYKLVEVINKSSLDIQKDSDSNGYVAKYALEVHSGDSKIVNKNEYLFYTYEGVNYLLGYIGTDTALTLPANYNGENYVIYKHAFEENDKITSVTIPDGVTSIGEMAFYDCYSLRDVYYIGTEEEWGQISIGGWNYNLTGATIHYNYVPEE
jgi:hypothetical protein